MAASTPPTDLGARILAFDATYPPTFPKGEALSDEERERLLARPVGEVLAGCLDLRGAVSIYDALRTPPKPLAPFPQIADRAALSATLRKAIIARLDVIRTRLIATLESRLRTKLPDAEEFAEALISSKSVVTRKARETDKAAAELYVDYRNMLRAGVERVRAEIQMLRDELAEDLRAFGPLAFRLDALDATLRKATAARANRLLERIPGVLAVPFQEALLAEVRALSSTPAPDEFRTLHRHMEDRFLAEGKELLLAFFQVERRTLDALVSEEVLCP